MAAVNIKACYYTLQLLILLLLQMMMSVMCYQYKVGDLSAWGIPTSANPNVYTKWAKNHAFRKGDSLLFLYPPSEDSVIQVSPESFKSCNLKDPILFMNDGNSLFNITSDSGKLYFTSGQPGHCQKGQKLYISLGANGSSDAYAPSADDAAAESPSYQNAFGSIPITASSSPPALNLHRFSSILAVASSSLLGLAICGIVF